jgi:serine/threonine protein kinase
MGIVLFTMLVGLPPFELASPDDPGYRIVQAGGLNSLVTQWKRPISPLAADLLHSMLRENPSERLSLFQIMNHPWVLQESQVSMEDLEKLAPDEGSDEDDELEQF